MVHLEDNKRIQAAINMQNRLSYPGHAGQKVEYQPAIQWLFPD
jgi:hypothetical protein